MRKRISSGILTCVIGVGLALQGYAEDINLSQHDNVSEATRFFTELASHSPNPLIASFARESLKKLQVTSSDRLLASAETSIDTKDQRPLKTLAVVTLLPQVDKTFVVPVVVNRKMMATFLVDTGASYTVITPETARALNVDLADENLPRVPVTTANGTVEAPLVTLKQITLGGMQVNNVQAVVADLGEATQLSGLLGMSFFQGMEISFKQDKLVISR